MIEEVDPSDTATLDEIDARFWCYRTNAGRYIGINSISRFITVDYGMGHEITLVGCPHYTRSFDCTYAKVPDGYEILINQFDDGFTVDFSNEDYLITDNEHVKLPTVFLALLHSVIQLIAFERGE